MGNSYPKITTFLFFFITCLSQTLCYSPSVIKFGRFNSAIVQKPSFPSKKTNTVVIFFTGGSSFITPLIYSKFIENLNENNIAVYSPCFNFKKKTKLIDHLSKQYTSIIVMGHSSGCSTAINFSVNQKKINKIVLLDPVDTFFFSKIDKIQLPYIRKILFIIANKSYILSFDPVGLPFIPFLGYRSLKKKIICPKNTFINCIKYNYGHSDILNSEYSNFMHYSRISVGNKIRTDKNLQNYHKNISLHIYKYLL